MAEQIVEMRLPNEGVVLARVNAVDGGGAEKVAALPNFDFTDVTRTLEGVATAVDAALTKVAPSKVVLELGLEVGAKNGKVSGLLIEGEGRGSLRVTLEWAGKGAGA